MAAITVAGTARVGLADNWVNPAGGVWTDGANWSEGTPPQAGGVRQMGAPAVFALGSTSGYTVTGGSLNGTITVQGDQVVLNNVNDTLQSESLLALNAASGQLSSLTLQSCNLISYNAGDVDVAGYSAGTAVLNAQGSTFIVNSEGGGSFDVSGTAGSVTIFNQSGGLIDIAGHEGGVYFGSPGTIDVNLNAASLNVSFGFISFTGAGQFTANIVSSTFNVGEGSIVFGGASQSDVVTDTGSTFTAPYSFTVGTTGEASFETGSPAAGGGNCKLSMTNDTLGTSELMIGASGGNGTVTASGAACNLGALSTIAVGYENGFGRLTLINGAQMSNVTAGTSGGNAYVGGSGGNGAIIISGTGSEWASIGRDIFVGTDNVGPGVGVIELDHGGFLSDPAGTEPYQGLGLITLSSTGSLEVLSGGRLICQSLNESSGSFLEIGVDGAAASANGLITLAGKATLAGTLDIDFENGFVPTLGEQFQLLTFAAESGQFATIETSGPYVIDSSQLYVNGTITVVAVPEPGVIGLVAAGVVFGGRRRIRRHP